MSFARVCVEPSWEDNLPKFIDVDIENFGSVKVRAEYPWKP